MTPPDHIVNKRILVPLGLGLILSLTGDATLYNVLPDPDIAAQAGVTLAMVGVLLGLNRLVRVVFNGLAGILYDRMPRRGLLIASLAVGAVSTMFYAAGRGALPMLAGRALWGLAWSGIWVGCNTVALDISDDRNRGRVSGQLQMWFLLGVALSSLAGGRFTDVFGYRSGLWISSALTLLGVVIWIVFLPETRPAEGISGEEESKEGVAPLPWKPILAAAVPTFALRFVFAGVIYSTTILWLSQFIDGGISVSRFFIPLATLTGGFSAGRVLVSMTGAPAAGRLSDSSDRRWPVMAGIMVLAWWGCG